jgi:hypothetical protein
MEKRVDTVIRIMMSGVTASVVAFWLAYIARYDFGLSHEEIRAPALVGAGIIAALVVIDFFGKELRKLE